MQRLRTGSCPVFCAHLFLTDYQNHVLSYYIIEIPFYKQDTDGFPILSWKCALILYRQASSLNTRQENFQQHGFVSESLSRSTNFVNASNFKARNLVTASTFFGGGLIFFTHFLFLLTNFLFFFAIIDHQQKTKGI